MISLIEAKNYRCLRYVKQPLGAFHVLVGPNASGKSTFLDVVAFLGQLVNEGLDSAIAERTRTFDDLLWQLRGDHFELAVEVIVPPEKRETLRDKEMDTVRYEVSIGKDTQSNEVGFRAEKVILKRSRQAIPLYGGMSKPYDVASVVCREDSEQMCFPMLKDMPDTIIAGNSKKGFSRVIINKKPGGNDNFYSEVYHESGKGWAPSYKLGPRKSALGNLPEDESKFPVSTWLKQLLSDGIQQFQLNSRLIRKASPPGQGRGFKTDGSNVPWVIENLARSHPEHFRDWLSHLGTALDDLVSVRTVEREDDKHRYLVLEYRGRLNVPSWMASDGTLRLLALTLPAYIPELSGVYLIEEPENGIHPRAVETMFQSLSSVYDAQILMATHSPVILSMVDARHVLCFAKTSEGATDIVMGSEHPALRDWRGETNLSVLFAGGVLG